MTKFAITRPYLAVIFLTSIVQLASHAESLDFSIADYRDTRKLSAIILDRCPPRNCFLVFPGRSLTPVAKYIEYFYPDSVALIPYSSIKGLPGEIFKPDAEGYMRDAFAENFQDILKWEEYFEQHKDFQYPFRHRNLSRSERENLFRHFDRFFPSDSVIRGRKVLVADFSDSGSGILSFHDYLT